MLLEHLRALLSRPALVLAGGMAIGALLSPAFGGAAQALTTYTRSTSCHGLGFFPGDSSTQYYRTNGARTVQSPQFVFCAIELPHKAVVTKLQIAGLDASATGAIQNCALVRNSLALAGTDAFQVVTAVNPTTLAAIPGRFLATTTTVNASYKTIDNANFAYFVQCVMDPPSSLSHDPYDSIQLYGATVTYQITAANG